MPQARADFELRDDKGRRVLLKDDGTWRYADAASAPAKADAEASPPAAAASAPVPVPQADLQLLSRTALPAGCQFDFVLHNTLPYEIRSIVPEFAAIRASGVVYTAQTVGFSAIKPGDKRQQSLRLDGIVCADIAKLQMLGGDRCEMGDLDRFSDAKGSCLERIRLMPTVLVKLEKKPVPEPVPPPPSASAASAASAAQ